MELATLQAISYIMGSLGVFVAAIYYVMTLRTTQRNLKANLETRQFQLLMQIAQAPTSIEGQRRFIEWISMDWDDYDDFEKKYGSDVNPENYALRASTSNWFNTMGLLVKNRMIDPELLYDFTGINVIWGWNKFKDVYVKQRELYDNPEGWKQWEYLYNEMKRIHERRGHSAESSRLPTKYSPEERE